MGYPTHCCIALLAAAFAIALAGHAGAADSPQRFKQDTFAIGLWVDPPMDGAADARYKELAEANFNLVLGGFGAHGPEKVARQLALCEKYGMFALVSLGDIPASELPESPACWGYRIKDEPRAEDFPGLAERVAEMRAARPGRLGYINLYPNYASPKQLGTDTYDAHVALFCETVNPDVLSMDHYPIFKPGKDGRDPYCDNLAVLRKYALQRGIPFWNFFNIMPYGPHTDPTEDQLRWQIYTSIAHGAKGVLYFCYYTPRGGEFPKGGAIIGRDNRPTRHYYQAQRLNAEVLNLGPALMKLTSTRVVRVKPGDTPAEVLKGTPIADINRADHDPEFDYLVGVFTHADGRRAVMLNNYHFAYTQWPTVLFDAPLEQVAEVDKQSGKERPAIDDSPDMEGIQVSLDAGEGRLFLMP